MPLPKSVVQWQAEVSRRLPSLSRPQARVLALWSFALTLTQHSGVTTNAAALALLLGQDAQTLRQRLREFTWPAARKRGASRRAVDVAACFPALLRWVLAWWAPAVPAAAPAAATPSLRSVALALDATTLGARFTVLSVSVLYRRTALPVAWAVTRANAPGAWLPHWERLIAALRPATAATAWQVVVLADRGLYSAHLFAAIQACGWHPVLRLQRQGYFRPRGSDRWWPLAAAVPQRGATYAARVVCFRGQPVQATLLGLWAPQHAEPWLLLTDLPPEGPAALSPRCYALRMWIECGFKALKRGGWGWQRTRMSDPARAERLWLVLALATLWVVAVGGAAEADQEAASAATRSSSTRSSSTRSRCPPLSASASASTSVFLRGLLCLRIAWLCGCGQDFPPTRFRPQPWLWPPPNTYP